jgi:hypothetical protein
MAVAARRLARPHAASLVARTALGERLDSLWISSGAQRAIRHAARAGTSARHAEAQARVCTLVDVATRSSVAVITAAELESARSLFEIDSRSDAALTVERLGLEAAAEARIGRDVVDALRRALGQRERMLLRPAA